MGDDFSSTMRAIEGSKDAPPQFELDVKGMKIDVVSDPVRAIVIDNFFGRERNREILDHIVSIKDAFKEATVGSMGGGRVFKEMRSNVVCYLDEAFAGRRQECPLLRYVDAGFRTSFVQEIVGSAQGPFSDFSGTNYHETQVSRYGDSGQKYEWHVDRFGADRSRHITFVYYFYREPKSFQGGEICFSDGVIFNGRLMNPQTAKVVEFEPVNDRAVIFSATTPHMVKPTTSPPEFADGRFSANIWVGFK